MRIAVLSETDPVETRVAATPDMVKKYKNLGADVVVQAGAGQASISDAEFEAVGATIAQNAGDAVKDADIVLKVRRPADGELNGLKKGALVIGIMDPYGQDAALKALADAGASAFAMELMPRITRAQGHGRLADGGADALPQPRCGVCIGDVSRPVLVDAQPAPNRVPD
jgi:NAD(P) transhydrogenase subunit alpha